ncbi:vWA domain-containing protein [Bdellovibrio svalbardensis]|uniref:VWA domain-containing protein n=1 Tax=Bdellovibrio svalbardensis TaxID=2972972 RepID=A0ABT6DH54_9BACT|nr:VWA domain-containing protein [Bdellovibrio svalbardensis]MDG0815829.1 VWA domain-containing protein [Bdellovibrio svalbardensis]
MTFHSAISFWLIVPLVILLVWTLWRKKKKTPTLQFGSVEVLKTVTPSVRTRLMHLPLLLKALAIVFAIIALARPQEMNTKIKKNVEGIDIVICLDISDSMLIEDMKPLNRLEAAKETIKKFIEGRSSDRIGLVIFAGESFTVVPPTLDYQLILQRVGEITTAQQARIKDGTALGVALANAAGRLKDSQAKSRVVIFMTDGENNSGTIDPETGLDIAKGYGVKIYSIGIGKDGPTRIPIYTRDIFGQKVKTYQPFDSTVNEDLLGRMAKDTGGKYYRASKEDSLRGIFKDIDSLEKTKIDINKFTNYTEKFPPYLVIAIILYLAALVLGRSWLRRVP